MIMSGNIAGASISVIDQLANAKAVFHPAVDATDSGEDYTPPYTEIDGVRVYTYVRDGILVVALDYDADSDPGGDVRRLWLAFTPGPFATYGDGDCVPTVFTAGCTHPVWTALPEGAELPAWVHGE
jgi:hypothetical protein